MFPVTPGLRNLSSSSISSSNSNHTLPLSYPASLTTHKANSASLFVMSESLPPKPPHSSGSSLIGPQSKSSLSSSSSPVSPMRRVGSMDRLGAVEFDPSIASTSSAAVKFFDRNKILDRKLGPLPFVPKHFGSLDSLKDIANGNNNHADGIVVSSSGAGAFGQFTNDPLGNTGNRIPSRDDYSPRSSEGKNLLIPLGSIFLPHA
jgi:hypothetical protein